jgi:hypothetical protein
VTIRPGTAPAWRTTDAIEAVAATGEGALVVVADVGADGAVTQTRLLHVRGGVATPRAKIDGDLRVLDAWAEDADHAWLVGEQGLLLRFDTDRLDDRSADHHQVVALGVIRGAGPADVFAAGEDGTVIHYDGVAWTTISPVESLATISSLSVGPDEVRLTGGKQAFALRVPRAPMVAPVCE